MERKGLIILMLTGFLLLAAAASAAISIAPEGTKSVGDRIVINGTTNFAAGNRILVEVRQLSFSPTNKTETAGGSGTAEIVTVVAGEPRNTWTLTVDTTGFEPGEYLVRAEVLGTDVVETATFFLLEAPGNVTPTATPIPSLTATPTASLTAATTVPATTPTQRTGAVLPVVVLIGIGLAMLLFRGSRK